MPIGCGSEPRRHAPDTATGGTASSETGGASSETGGASSETGGASSETGGASSEAGGSAGSGAAAGEESAGSGGLTEGGVIVVDTAPDQVATQARDGRCDLLEAIEAANTDQAVDACAAGNGADRIVLRAGARYPVTKTLAIDTAVTLATTGGSDRATISAAPGFSSPGDVPGPACLLHALAGGLDVKLEDVDLTQDALLPLTGACVTSGWLELRRTRVSGFASGGIAALCLPELGCDHAAGGSTTLSVLSSLVDDNRNPAPGGGIFSEGAGTTLYVGSSAIVNNTSEGPGGGVYVGGGWSTQKIATSTISGNRAESGGGVYARFGACTATYLFITNSTIAYNTATSVGGGIDFDAQIDCHAQDVTVLASIVTNNTALETDEDDIDAEWQGGMFECDRGSLLHVAPGFPLPSQVGDVPCTFDVPDALLAPLIPMGGVSNLPLHPLRAGSPAIDAALDDLTEDQQRDSWIAISDPRPAPPPWALFERVVDGDGDGVAVPDLGAFEANEVWQTELLRVLDAGSGSHAVVTTPDGYDRGAGTTYEASGASGQFLTYVVPIAEAGNYRISVRVRRAEDGAELRAEFADDPAGPWLTSETFDTYAPSSRFDEFLLLGVDVSQPGQKLLRFTVSGKNPESAGFRLYLDSVRVQRSP